MKEDLKDTVLTKGKRKIYKLAREKLFSNYCEYCGMTDCNKYYMRSHIKEFYDENGKEIRMFRFKKCNETITEREILTHECH